MPRDAEHLSDLSTWASVLLAARPDAAPAETKPLKAARGKLFDYYAQPIQRYLHGLLREHPDREHLVHDLFNEFALRFCEGKFKSVVNLTGRFRHYLKQVLRHLVTDIHRERPSLPLADGVDVPDGQPGVFDAVFEPAWKQGVIDRCMARLREEMPAGAAVLAAALEHPELSYEELLPKLNEVVPAEVTDPIGWLRTQISRARKRFREFLVDDVKVGLSDHSAASVEAELKENGLWRFFPQKASNA